MRVEIMARQLEWKMLKFLEPNTRKSTNEGTHRVSHSSKTQATDGNTIRDHL